MFGVVVLSIFYVFSLFLINSGLSSDINFSIIYVLISFLSLYTIWNNSEKKINLFLLHIITFNLFIGGRFFLYIFDRASSPFEPTFFYSYYVSNGSKIEIFTFVISFLCFSTIGHFLSYKYRIKKFLEPQKKGLSKEKIDKVLQRLFPILSVIVIYMAFDNFMQILKNGYGISLISVQNKVVTVSFISKFSSLALNVFLGLSIAYGKGKTTFKYIILYSIRGLLSILAGTRADFGIVVLMIIWVYSMRYKFNLKKILISGAVGLFILLFLFAYSVRESKGGGGGDFSPLMALRTFVYTNGVSLMVFDAARQIQNYPLLPYFQAFITGSSFFYSLFSGVTLHPQDISFEGHLCYTLNPELFNSGFSLGWTTIGDLYLFSGRILFFYCIVSIIFGFIIGTIECWSKKSDFFKYVAIAIAPPLLMMPRGGFANLFPMFVYVYFFFFAILYLSRFTKNKINK